jgi:hypothetical protein
LTSERRLTCASRIPRTSALVCVLLSIIVPFVARAQLPDVAPGARVRLDIGRSGTKIEGTVTSQTSDSISVATGSAIWALPTASITRVRVSGGKSQLRGAVRGMKIGALVLGGGFGALVAVAALGSGEGASAIPLVALFGGIAAAEGAIIGGLIGGIVGSERWTNVYPNNVGVILRPAGDGTTSLGLSWTF